MKAPPRWTTEQLTAEVKESTLRFRRERLREPLEKWKSTFDTYQGQFERLFEEFSIARPTSLSHTQLAKLFKEKLGDALRYIAGPPISADDLKVLAEASLAPGRIATDGEAARRIRDTILQALDPIRFPWVEEDRMPTEYEKKAAILASAALITAQRVHTERRNEGKEAQHGGLTLFWAHRLGDMRAFVEATSRA
jgi:hypothetical protein